MGDALLSDLADEHAALDEVVAGIDDSAWDAPTPAPGWRVRDQIGHLTYFDGTALLSATDPDAFAVHLERLLTDRTAFEAEATAIGRSTTGTPLLDLWRQGREAMLVALADVPDGARLAWYGPPMSVRSFATARLMETWAHGQDVVDGLRDAGAGAPVRTEGDRIRHVCHLGVATFGWSWRVRGAEPPVPDGSVRVELVLPSSAPWAAGPESSPDAVRGLATDFCLVVTQRRHVEATALEVVGPVAEAWMRTAQCFAGGPTVGPSAPE